MHVRERAVRNARELVDSALGALFSGAEQLRDPASRLSRSVASFWAEQRNARPNNFREFHETLGTFRLGQLWCQASERFVLLPGSNRIGIEPTLEFRSTSDSGDPRELRVVLQWAGTSASERVELEKRALTSGLRTIFVPNSIPKPKARWSWADDVRALLLIYLAQAQCKMIDLDRDEAAYTFLRSYVEKYRGSREIGTHNEIGVHNVIAEVLRLYKISLDYRGLRKYIAATIRGMRAAANDTGTLTYTIEQGEGEAGGRRRWMIPGVARELRIPRRTIYAWIKVGRVRAMEIKASDHRMYLTIGEEELSRLREEHDWKLTRRRVIDEWASSRHIDRKSASRWVKLQEDNGATLEEIQARVEGARKDSSG